MQGEERLIFAIVAQAVRDYQRALRYLRLPANKKTESGEIAHERLKKDCEIFFRSKWYYGNRQEAVVQRQDTGSVMVGGEKDGVSEENYESHRD